MECKIKKHIKKAHNCKDISGYKFGTLTVLKQVDKPEYSKDKDNRAWWLTVCECGSTKIYCGKYLREKQHQCCRECVQRRTKTINENYFNKIDTEEKAYILGFIVAVCKNRSIYSLSYSGKHNAKKFYDYLYKDAALFLKRKKDKFDIVIVSDNENI